MLKLLLSCLLIAGTAFPATLIIGAPADLGTGNCFPFGCATGTRYQQVYDASNFSGPVSISKIIFYADAYTSDTNTLATGTWDLYLSTTSRAVNTIDDFPFDTNLGPDNALFATVVGPFVIPNIWEIPGGPFSYNPGDGNLLLDIHASLTGSGSLYLNARNGTAGGIFSRAHNFGSQFDNWGLVTGFEVSESEIPETATFSLVGAGLCALTALRRLRR